jgi:hypothetical protein
MTATEEERDDAYRAVGRYVVEFSRLIFHMRLGVIHELANDRDSLPHQLALGGSSARQISDAFFAICEYVMISPEADEIRIGRRLQRDVNEEIKKRNDVAHGDWWVGFGRKESGEGGDPRLLRVKPSKRAGAFEARDIPVAELDQWSDDLYALRQFVAEYGAIRLNTFHSRGLRVRDIFVMRDGRVVREGPKAADSRVEFS